MAAPTLGKFQEGLRGAGELRRDMRTESCEGDSLIPGHRPELGVALPGDGGRGGERGRGWLGWGRVAPPGWPRPHLPASA
ncbi:hypothetical protein H8959_021642 [Pygathrix nigripes]